MKFLAAIARYLLGVMFTVFGLNGFLHFIQPSIPDGPAKQFMQLLTASHYGAAVFAVQLVCGVLFLIGAFVPLALVMIAPVIVNILLFHATMAPAGIALGAVAAGLWVVLAFRCRAAFSGILRRRMPA